MLKQLKKDKGECLLQQAIETYKPNKHQLRCMYKATVEH